MNRVRTPSHASHADVAADGLRQLPPFVQISSWATKEVHIKTQKPGHRETDAEKKAETCELSPEFLTHICIIASFASLHHLHHLPELH